MKTTLKIYFILIFYTFTYYMEKLKQFFFSFFLLLFSLALFAQKEANIWYFGSGPGALYCAGLDFNSGSPVALDTCAMLFLGAQEGSAVISDTSGQLLFYTNGSRIFNRNHAGMLNGSGLMGGCCTTTQPAVIVKQPGNDSLYYIFTADAFNDTDGFRYSIVDMTLDGGLGAIVSGSKNILLHVPTTEKVTAVRHCNGKDIWAIGHEWDSDAFYAYLLTDAGIVNTVVSNVGTVHTGDNDNKIGYLKGSPNGKRLALALNEDNIAELLDFDNSTGIISNPITMSQTGFWSYGISFSPDNSRLYVSVGLKSIYQYDLNAGSAAAIIASRTLIGSTASGVGALQIAPDGKIYLARSGSDYLGVINNPNALGVASNYVDDGFYLGGINKSWYGLPNFMETIVSPIDIKADFSSSYT